jgi:hypothetical protein
LSLLVISMGAALVADAVTNGRPSIDRLGRRGLRLVSDRLLRMPPGFRRGVALQRAVARESDGLLREQLEYEGDAAVWDQC